MLAAWMRSAVLAAGLVLASSAPSVADLGDQADRSAFYAGLARAPLQIATPSPAAPRVARGTPLHLHALVTDAARRHGVPPSIAHGVIRAESNYQCHARSHAGARGIGQVLPATARSMGVTGNLYDCRTGLEASMRYLRLALARGGSGCAGVSLYERGIAARPHCSAYGRKVMRLATLG